ncbi:MAG: ABC transporter ATP-binding protein, partial [Eggerthella lenta]
MTDSAGGVAAADAVAVPAEKAPLPNPRAASAEPAATKPFARLRSLAAPHRGLYFKSILLAVAGVACGFLPYVAVANIATALIAGTTDLAFYLGWCALAAAGQVAKAFL